MKQAEIAALLPDVMRRTVQPRTPLAALLAVMEALHAPAEQALDGIDGTFDPYRAPDPFVPYLAGWVDLDRLLSTPPAQMDEAALLYLFDGGLGRLRELLAQAATLSRRRGTAQGLIRFLETATGVAEFTISEQVAGEDGQPRPYHIEIRAPDAARPFDTLIRRIIELEKPAYVTYDLAYAAAEST